MEFCSLTNYSAEVVKMNYFTNFLGLFFLGALWLYLTLIIVDGVVGFKDFLKNLRVWKH